MESNGSADRFSITFCRRTSYVCMCTDDFYSIILHEVLCVRTIFTAWSVIRVSERYARISASGSFLRHCLFSTARRARGEVYLHESAFCHRVDMRRSAFLDRVR